MGTDRMQVNIRRTLPGLALGVFAAAMPLSAQVEMRSVNMCLATFDQLNPQYTNNTSSPIDMRGFGVTVGPTKVRGQLNTGGGLVQPGAIAGHNGPGCGGVGVPIRHQMEHVSGSCNEIRPPDAPAALQCNAGLLAAVNRDPARCVQDGLGVGRGDGYGGIVDSWLGETQIQVRIPTQTWSRTPATGPVQTVRFDPGVSMGGPMYLMSLAAVQEFLYVDMQFLLALGASKTGAGIVDNGTGASLYQTPPNLGTDAQAIYSSFGINMVTLQKLANAYPKFMPPVSSLNSMVSAGGVSGGASTANGPQQASSAMLGALNLWWYLDAVQQGTNLCFRQYVRTATDRSAGLKVLLSGYENGPGINTGTFDFATQVLPAAAGSQAMTMADVTTIMKPYQWGVGTTDFGTTNYVSRVFDALKVISTAGNTCGSAPIYDAPITRTQVKELFFGVNGSVATQGPGGLLWHLKISAAQRRTLWDDLDCAFDRLKGSAPSSPGPEAISFRYDFLPILRVARGHLGGFLDKFDSKPTEMFGEYAGWVVRHSDRPCQAALPDNTWPTLLLSADTLGLDQVIEGAGTRDDRGIGANDGIRDREYTLDQKWLSWSRAPAPFRVPTTMATGTRMWYRVSDSCGNYTTQEVLWKDLPQLPMPIASPANGTTFNGGITVTLSMPPAVTGAEIYYSTNGGNPTTRFTVPFNATGTADITIKAIAKKPGFRDSEILIVIYRWVAIPPSGQPVLDPPSRTFTTLDPDFPVRIRAATGAATGTVLLYSTDGNEPDTTVTSRTFLYSDATPINVSGTVTIKAIAKEPGKLPSASVTGIYTENPAPKVATPMASPGAGTFMAGPHNVILTVAAPAGAAISYSLNGGPATAFTGAIPLMATTTLKAWATAAGHLPSDTLTVTYTYSPPVGVMKAWYLDKDGDGRIETAVIDYDKPLKRAPLKIAFNITDDRGVSESRTADGGQIRMDGQRVTVTLNTPFAFGITSIANSGTSGQHFEDIDIPLFAGAFAMDDSVAPVIIKAEILEPDSTRKMKIVTLTYSEKVLFDPAATGVTTFKRDAGELPAGVVRYVGPAAARPPTGFAWNIDSTSNPIPIVGDSAAIALGGGIRDAFGNTPSRKLFQPLEGDPPKAKPSKVYVTFPNGTMIVPRGLAVEPTTNADVSFIPVGLNASPLPGGRDKGKCQGCPVGGEGAFVGPVIYMEIPGACDYEFSIFNNLGEFVVSGKGRIEDSDLELLTPIANGTLYLARVIWTGRTARETKAGTGAYVLQAVTKTQRNLRTGAPAANSSHRIRFGLLRSYRGS